jgi:hypothetical protein
MNDDECKAEFIFYGNNIYNLIDVLRVPPEITCYNGLKVNGTEAMCIFLKIFAYPFRYVDLTPRFARPAPQLCMIANKIMDIVYQNWNHLLINFEQPWLDNHHLESYAAKANHLKGAAFNNCWGFIDGTVRQLSRPGRVRRLVYNEVACFMSQMSL